MQSCSRALPSSPAPPHILWPLLPLLEWKMQRRTERKAKKRRQRGGDETRGGGWAESQERDRFTVMGS